MKSFPSEWQCTGIVSGVHRCFLSDAAPYIDRGHIRVAACSFLKITKTDWQVTPWDVYTVAVQHGVNEQSVAQGMPRMTRQKVPDEFPLGIKQGVSFTHGLYMGWRQDLSTMRGL
ncbi:hypothetical protein ACDW_43890 (plasmid) [Acidovorax sp. DW039]|nr:hypothetical protein ACDW_43890 [Acidovorax sp. DW039]